jgi:predicted NBD/HSP70 family sugar kinase
LLLSAWCLRQISTGATFDLKTPLEKATGLPVELENACKRLRFVRDLVRTPAPKAHRISVALTVSEGIGTGLVMNHQLVRGSTGVAGEFGHTTIVENGLQCACGNKGCWELYASNSAAVRYYTGTKVSAQTPTFDDILRLASQGDPKASEALNKMAYYLGRWNRHARNRPGSRRDFGYRRDHKALE